MASYTELIDKYINNELSAEDRKKFEEHLNTNPTLKKEYDLQAELTKGAQRMGLKKEVNRSFKKVKTGKTIMKIALVSLSAIVVMAGVYFIKQKMDRPQNNIRYELNEQGLNNWSEADRSLESQVFEIDPTKDTVIETKGGIVVSIPANAFLNKFGETEKGRVEIELKEALTPLDIMKAGLSTSSNGKLLETGGMFYLNARSGKDNLDINLQKPLQAAVPYRGERNDMMLFDGERQKDGSINWIKPIPTEKQLITTNITKLDFYPPHFLDSVAAWGYDRTNKKLTDSLYYSFIGFCGTPATDTSWLDMTLAQKVDMMTGKSTKPVLTGADSTKRRTIDGQALFRANCAVCHSAGEEKLTGPGLLGIEDRAPKGDWLFRYISNNEKMIKEGDPYANKILAGNNGAAMTVFEGTLAPEEINAIIDYITHGRGGVKIRDEMYSECPEIDPSCIKAMWDPEFNNTILATKEFEERLKVIFTTCNDRILHVYTDNLGKSLWVLDSVAASLCSGEQKQKFLEFYRRHDGGVKIGNDQEQKLQRYLSDRRETYRQAAQIAMQKITEEENKKDDLVNEERMKHWVEESERNSTVFKEELEINMKEAYRQLGKEYRPTPPATNYVSAPVTTTGWKNVDAYVLESTINRTTLDYTDPESGKKAVIKYEEATVEVKDVKAYDKVMVYLLPDKLSSFQLMKNTGTIYKENLNELMKYHLVAVGFKGEKVFVAEINNIKTGNYSVQLKPMPAELLQQRLAANTGMGSKAGNLGRELEYQLFEQKETIRQAKKLAMELLRERMAEVIFPCYTPVSPPANVYTGEVEY